MPRAGADAAAALELFTAHGYRNTTIAAIAEHADVATRTVTLHFPTKEDLLFAGDPFTPESLAARLGENKGEGATLDVVREWMRDTMRALDERAGAPAGTGPAASSGPPS